jgi:hypothetical protein
LVPPPHHGVLGQVESERRLICQPLSEWSGGKGRRFAVGAKTDQSPNLGDGMSRCRASMVGPVEAIRVLVGAKRSARQARGKPIGQMRSLGFTAPEQLHGRLTGLSVTALIAESAKLRPSRSSDPVTAATKALLSSLAHRSSNTVPGQIHTSLTPGTAMWRHCRQRRTKLRRSSGLPLAT